MLAEDKFKERVSDIIKNAEEYHQNFYKKSVFIGPSLYFHRKSLESMDSKDFERCLENIYAVLVSWGMHRMGQRGPKMNDFDNFKKSVYSVKNEIEAARKMEINNIKAVDFRIIGKIFKTINVMRSKTIIVGNSKVMAHLLPKLIPPVDREYTMRFIKGNTYIANGKEKEWELFKKLIEKFFHPIALDRKFLKLARGWMKKGNEYEWDTSIPKIIDNLIIGSFKNKRI